MAISESDRPQPFTPRIAGDMANKLPPLPEPADPHTAPATIRDDYNKICAGLRARGLDPAELLVLGRTGRRWTIAMQYDERTGIHVTYTRNNAGQWGISDRCPLQGVRDGTDHSAEANGDVARAMQLMLHGHPGSGPAPGDRTPATVRPASGTTGERVRKTRRHPRLRQHAVRMMASPDGRPAVPFGTARRAGFPAGNVSLARRDSSMTPPVCAPPSAFRRCRVHASRSHRADRRHRRCVRDADRDGYCGGGAPVFACDVWSFLCLTMPPVPRR